VNDNLSTRIAQLKDASVFDRLRLHLQVR